MKITKTILGLLLCAFITAPVVAHAQATSYLDEAGNLHFVDSPSQVPDKFKTQLIKAKPTVLDKKQYKEELSKWKKRHSTEEKEKKKREKEKEKERKKLEKEMAKRDRQRGGSSGRSSSSSKGASPPKFNSEANATPAPIVR